MPDPVPVSKTETGPLNSPLGSWKFGCMLHSCLLLPPPPRRAQQAVLISLYPLEEQKVMQISSILSSPQALSLLVLSALQDKPDRNLSLGQTPEKLEHCMRALTLFLPKKKPRVGDFLLLIHTDLGIGILASDCASPNSHVYFRRLPT